MLTQAELVDKIDQYLQRTGVSAASFGRAVAHDPNLVHDIRKGRSPQLRLVHRILDAIKASEVSEALAQEPSA